MLKAALENMASVYRTMGHPAALETFILRNAAEVRGDPLPAGIKPLRAKECFSNATHLSMRHAGFEYYEGLAATDRLGIPMLHAWCVHRGCIIDATWQEPHLATYMGVHIPKHTLHRTLLKTKMYGVFDNGLGLNIDLMCELDHGFADAIGYTPRERGTR